MYFDLEAVNLAEHVVGLLLLLAAFGLGRLCRAGR